MAFPVSFDQEVQKTLRMISLIALDTSQKKCASSNIISRGTSLRTILLSALILLSLNGRTAAGVLTKEDISDIKNFIEHIRDCYGIMSVSFSLVQGNEVVSSRGFGHIDLEKQTKVTEDTPFCIGSLSKAFTTTLLAMQLAEDENGVDWDTPLHCFPGADHISFSDDIRSSQTTMADILSHRVGIPGYFGILLVGYPPNTTRPEIVKRIRFMPPTAPFRSAFQYNNFLYALAGYGAELLGGRNTTWEQLTQTHIFDPLGMASSGYVDKITEPPGLAQPYVFVNKTVYQLDPEALRSVSPLGPAGSIYSTASDMARWIQFHLAVMDSTKKARPAHTLPLDFPGRIKLSPETVRKVAETYEARMPEPPISGSLFRPHFPIDDLKLSYAMGWVRGIYRGYRKVMHTGGILSYVSLLQLLPDVDAGLFLSTAGPGSRAGGTFNRLVAAYIADKLTGNPHWFNRTTACTFPAPWVQRSSSAAAEDSDYEDAESVAEDKQPEAMPKLPRPPPESTLAPPLTTEDMQGLSPLEVFTGKYGHYAFGEVTVYSKADRLYARYGSFGHFRLDATPVVGLFSGSFLDILWYLSNQDEEKHTVRFQFTNVQRGQALHLVLPIDPSTGSTFTRSLDINSFPPQKRAHQDLFKCRGSLLNTSSSMSPSSSFVFVIGISSFISIAFRSITGSLGVLSVYCPD